MKILHVCLASHYTEGMTYQDNQLADQNAKDGHEVVVISDCYKFVGHSLEEVEEEDIILSSGVRLIRMKYDYIINNLISSKIRKVKSLKKFLYSFRPDVILFHGVAGYEMLTVAEYKRKNRQVKLYIDSHEDYHNSGTFWFSLFFQYKVFNRYIVNKVKSSVDKFLYLSYESKRFCQDVYSLEDDEMEFYPLGGNVISFEYKEKYKFEVRKKLALSNDDIIILHSGKFSSGKKTKDLLESFCSVPASNLKLVLVGSIPEDMSTTLNRLIASDKRILFLGWMNSSELIKYLSAADIYVQPGTQSATMQNAICCGTPVALYPYPSHEPYVIENGIYIESKSDYNQMFLDLSASKLDLLSMSKASFSIARNLLDYQILAKRLYE